MAGRSFRFDRPLVAAVHDAIMAGISFVAALYLRLGNAFWDQTRDFLIEGTVLFIAVCVPVFGAMRLYRGLWRYASLNDMIAIVKAVSIAMLIFAMAMFLLTRLEAFPRSAFVINWLVLLLLLGGPRFAYRLWKDGNLTGLTERGYDQRIPVLLVGAGDAAEAFVRAMRRPGQRYRVVGLVDDNPANIGRNLHGIRVLTSTAEIPMAVKKLRRRGMRPRRLLLADERLRGAAVRQLLETADAHGMTLARVPRPTDFESDQTDHVRARPVALEDLLGRPQTRLDRAAMAALIAGRRVLITGAGGTIGSELARQVAALAPASLILVDSSEYNLYRVDREIADSGAASARQAILADIRDQAAVQAIFQRHRPERVLHAAAIKHVPIAEANICETALTNVLGTRIIAEAARAVGAEAMVLISTDKAVNPSNIMGATKRLAEAYCQSLDRGADTTRFVTVRFGNVLGSTGSVVPLFQDQLAAGGPLTVTHPEITRYFMTTREAVELVLQATTLGLDSAQSHGGIFVLDMGEPVRIIDLARQMIRLAGLRPDIDIAIAVTGLRPGEKLHEELFHEQESLVATAHESIRLGHPRAADAALLARRIDDMTRAARDRDADAVIDILGALVPEFRPRDDRRTPAVR